MKGQKKTRQLVIAAMIIFFAAFGVATAQNIVKNGSFEKPFTSTTNGDPNNAPAGVNWNAFPSSNPDLGWIVEWRADVYNWLLVNGITLPGQVGVLPPLLELQANGVLPGTMADDGVQWAELDSDWTGPYGDAPPNPPYRGANPGNDYKPDSISIHQHLDTSVVGPYTLSFVFGARPGSGGPFNGQPQNKLEVQWNGQPLNFLDPASSTILPYVIQNPPPGFGSPIPWRKYTIVVQATGPSSELRFTDLGYADSYGTYLDSVIVTEGGNGCTRTVGYWKTHSSYGPAAREDETWLLLPQGPDTMFFSTNRTWYETLITAPKGDAYLILAHQYIAAYLNLLAAGQGVSDPELFNKMAEAKALLQAYSTAPRNMKQQFVALADYLTRYNEGVIGPGHCFEETSQTEAFYSMEGSGRNTR